MLFLSSYDHLLGLLFIHYLILLLSMLNKEINKFFEMNLIVFDYFREYENFENYCVLIIHTH